MAESGISVIFPAKKLGLWSGPVDDALWPVENTDGDPFKMTGAAFTAGVSGNQIVFVDATPGLVTNIPSLAGKSVNAVFRGGYGMGKVVATDPQGSQVQWDPVSADLTVPENQDWVTEVLLIFYTN